MFTNLPERDDDRAVLVRIALADTDALTVEVLSAELFELGATGIEEQAGSALLVGFPNRAAAAVALDALAASPLAASIVTTALVDVPDDTWFDGWRTYAKAQRAGRHLVVHPPWVPLQADPPIEHDLDLVLEIDPGRSFGSGAHPTTRLVLAELERRVGPHSRVLDLGCGSGVLGIAAARLGARQVLAVDIDPAALAATAANQARNGVSFEVRDELGDPPDGGAAAPFDVVAANIGANTLLDLAPALVRWGEVLLLSGFFAGRADEVAAAYARCGAKLLNRSVEDVDGWAALTLSTSAS